MNRNKFENETRCAFAASFRSSPLLFFAMSELDKSMEQAKGYWTVQRAHRVVGEMRCSLDNVAKKPR